MEAGINAKAARPTATKQATTSAAGSGDQRRANVMSSAPFFPYRYADRFSVPVLELNPFSHYRLDALCPRIPVPSSSA